MRRLGILLFLLLRSFVLGLQDEEENEQDPGLFRFRSRPDLTPTRWNITTYHEDRLAPGYWFIGPYRILNQATFGAGWVGAHIYDQKGELVWSGAKMFSRGNIEDFKLSNVNGVELMTLMDQGRGEAVILDHHYDIQKVVKMDHFNSHELQFVQNGTKALIVKGNAQDTTIEMSRAIGWEGPRMCRAGFDKFVELDVAKGWEPVFEWSPYGTVGLDESTMTEKSVEKRCGEGVWDYIHANSVDKTDEGDYLFSGRHTDTLYKISKDTHELVWRLGGTKSDFPISSDVKFSRQHDVRYRGKNQTHMFVSILDNAKGIDHSHPPTHAFSRGLLLAINEKDMTVAVAKQLDHPHTADRYSPRRGNYQVLPNGNIFMGWSEQGCQSEHAEDGTLLQEAIFSVKWLGTYRQYKFPFVGRPTNPPDVYGEVVATPSGGATTEVHVSWNGATEVRSWQLYKTTKSGEPNILISTTEKAGFETKLTHTGYASYVVVKGLDKDGQVLGESKIFKTEISKQVSASALVAEKQWLASLGEADTDGKFSRLPSVSDHPAASFFVGFILSAGLLLAGLYARRKGLLRIFRSTRYSRLRSSKEDPGYQDLADEFDERSLPLQASRKEQERI